MKKEFIGTIEAADFCKVSRPTMRKWIDNGWIDAYITPGGTARIPVKKLISTMRKHKMPVPDKLLAMCAVKVLIIEDDANHLHLMESALKDQANYFVETARNGYEACIKMGNFKPDLIISDLIMPFMNGVELIKEVRRNPLTSGAKVVVVTGYPDSEEARIASNLGVDHFINKPIDVKKFKKTLDIVSDLAEHA